MPPAGYIWWFISYTFLLKISGGLYGFLGGGFSPYFLLASHPFKIEIQYTFSPSFAECIHDLLFFIKIEKEKISMGSMNKFCRIWNPFLTHTRGNICPLLLKLSILFFIFFHLLCDV